MCMNKPCTLYAHIAHPARTDSTSCTHPAVHTACTLQAWMVHLKAIRTTMTYFAQARHCRTVDWLDAIYSAWFVENKILCSWACGRRISNFRFGGVVHA